MSNCTMLTQTHMQQFNELTSSKLRNAELVKELAIFFFLKLHIAHWSTYRVLYYFSQASNLLLVLQVLQMGVAP